MRAMTTLTVLVIGLAGAFTLVPSAPAAEPSQPVTVTNTTPVPVSVTGTVSLGAPQRQPLFLTIITFNTSAYQSVSVTYPTGYTRLVIDRVSYEIYTPTGEVIEPQLWVYSPTQLVQSENLPVPPPQAVNNSQSLYVNMTTGLGMVVDSGNLLYVEDHFANTNSTDIITFRLTGHFEP